MSKYVNIQKDIGEYNEKLVAGLSMRGLIGIGVGVGLAAIIVVIFVVLLGMDIQVASVPIMLVAVCVFGVSFLKPLGMPAEKAAQLYWQQTFGTTQLAYRSSCGMALAEVIEQVKKKKTAELEKETNSYAQNEIKEYKRLRRGRGRNCAEILLSADQDES